MELDRASKPIYSVKSIQKRLRRPRLISQEINRLYHRRLRLWSFNQNWIDVLDADWDNLRILHACRYDLCDRTAKLPGETVAVESRDSSTRAFLRGNFHGRTMLDTVYVTARPMLHRHRNEIDLQFHEDISVWQDQGWNETYRTVLPETVTEAAVNAATRFSKKRSFILYPTALPVSGPNWKEAFQPQQAQFPVGQSIGGRSRCPGRGCRTCLRGKSRRSVAGG